MLNPHQKAFNKFNSEVRKYWSHSVFTRQDSMLHTQQMVMRKFEVFMNEIVKKERKLKEGLSRDLARLQKKEVISQ